MSNNRLKDPPDWTNGWPFGWIKEHGSKTWHMSYDPDAHIPTLCNKSIPGSPSVWRHPRIWEHDVDICGQCVEDYLKEQMEKLN